MILSEKRLAEDLAKIDRRHKLAQLVHWALLTYFANGDSDPRSPSPSTQAAIKLRRERHVGPHAVIAWASSRTLARLLSAEQARMPNAVRELERAGLWRVCRSTADDVNVYVYLGPEGHDAL